jgi:threonine/homoserine/homoserine lactone efflux protein
MIHVNRRFMLGVAGQVIVDMTALLIYLVLFFIVVLVTFIGAFILAVVGVFLERYLNCRSVLRSARRITHSSHR